MALNVILASASPRRLALLNSAGIRTHVSKSGVVERRHAREPATEFVTRMACDKASAVRARESFAEDPRPVIGADTIVCLDDLSFGKPASRQDAQAMLETLSGRHHEVLTAVCVIPRPPAAPMHIVATTRVTFSELSAEQIAGYLDSAAWQDKAGAYAIQEHAACMVRRIEGSYSNVVGLPLCETLELLKTGAGA